MDNQLNFRVGTEFQSYAQFREQLENFEKSVQCNFSVFSSKTLTQNRNISANDVEVLKYKHARFNCKFSNKPRETVSSDVRKRVTTSFKQDCPAYFTIASKKANNVWVLRILKFEGTHTHAISGELFKVLPKQRRNTIDAVTPLLQHIINVQPNFQLVQNEVSSASGFVKRSDLYNYRAKNKNIETGLNDLQSIVKEMKSIKGAVVKVLHNEQQELEAIYIQDCRMKTFFENYPDLLMFDGTYKLNDRRMPLIVLLIIDGNGESQIVGFFIVKSENAPVLNVLFEHFKVENKNYIHTEIIVTDKSLAFHNAIEHQFPNALHNLCVFHVAQIFLREITTKKRDINGEQRANCLKILNNMIYAESPQRFDELYEELLDQNCPGKLSLL